MWGTDALVAKDQERQGQKSKAYLAAADDADYDGTDGVWYEEDEPPSETTGKDYSDNEVWFEEACTALLGQPADETVLANFQEAKSAFYKDARRALDQDRMNRGYYPGSQGKGKGHDQGKGEPKGGEFLADVCVAANMATKQQVARRAGTRAKVPARVQALATRTRTGPLRAQACQTRPMRAFRKPEPGAHEGHHGLRGFAVHRWCADLAAFVRRA